MFGVALSEMFDKNTVFNVVVDAVVRISGNYVQFCKILILLNYYFTLSFTLYFHHIHNFAFNEYKSLLKCTCKKYYSLFLVMPNNDVFD